jgi:hypothetical protein
MFPLCRYHPRRTASGAVMQIAVFYLSLFFPILIWAAIVLPNYIINSSGISTAVIYSIVSVSPLVGGDISLFGEITPVILAGLIITLLPASKDGTNYLAIFIALLDYLAFLHLNIYFSDGPGVGLISANWDNIVEPQKILLSVVSNIRTTAIVIAFSILGLKVRPAA